MAFDAYAGYYDLLYKDKDYKAEAEYIYKTIENYFPGTKSVLELGCGTGKHAEILSQHGYKIHGVDMSEGMLAKAIERNKKNNKLTFSKADIRKFDFGCIYDVIDAWFHVMSYQTTDEDIVSVFANVARHLSVGGGFIFDCWYGPAVLWQKPELRVKRFKNDVIEITRIAESDMEIKNSIVNVNYDIFVKDLFSKEIKEIKEKHRMRYFFDNEIKYFANEMGFTLLDRFEFMTNRPLSEDTWGSCFVLRKE